MQKLQGTVNNEEIFSLGCPEYFKKAVKSYILHEHKNGHNMFLLGVGYIMFAAILGNTCIII